MILKKSNIIKKSFSFDIFPQNNIFLGNIPENSVGFRVDIDSTLDKGEINIRDEKGLLFENLKVTGRTISIYTLLFGDIFIDFKEVPTIGIINIYIYYIFSDSFVKIYFDYNDFQYDYKILSRVFSRRMFNLVLEIDEVFDSGTLFFGNDNEKDEIAKVDLIKAPYRKFLFEGDSQKEIKMFFEGNPTKGKGNVSILYFDL